MEAERESQAAVSLLQVWPDLAASVPVDERGQAERALAAPLIEARGAGLTAALAGRRDAFDFVIVRGIVIKETAVDGRSALELLTAGDVLAPLPAGTAGADGSTSHYQGLGDVGVAVLETRFQLVAQRWPVVGDCLHRRLTEQVHRASLHLAMLHLPRAEDRIETLFADLARRLGRVTPDGIAIEVDLTHDVIGQLVGSRRPTVSLALQTLEAQGRLTRRDSAWLLHQDAGRLSAY